MKLLLSSLLLSSLCNLSSWSVASDTLVVTQTADLSVMEGETVNISCCFRANFDRMTVKWRKNHTDVKHEVFNVNNSQMETSGCSNLNFTNIRTEDSGRYICKVSVEIPYYIEKNGNGTKITVSQKKNRTQDETEASDPDTSPISNPPALPVIISLAIVAPLLLVALVCFCTLQRRQARAARVIYEVPHIDSDVAEMDKHSTSSSRGSSQWCQVPVYESFDYFERVQTKESG